MHAVLYTGQTMTTTRTTGKYLSCFNPHHCVILFWLTWVTELNDSTRTGTRQCLKGSGFMSYAGNYTIEDQCLPWTDNAVHIKGFQLWMFPGSKSWIDMKDHCRNPDNDIEPWCYNRTRLRSDGVLEKLYCGDGIPACCKFSLYIYTYMWVLRDSILYF